MIDTNPSAPPGSTPPVEPVLRPEARVVRADRSLAAMVLVICTLGGMGIGFGFAMYLMRAQLAFAPGCPHRTPSAVVARANADHITWLGIGIRSFSSRNGCLVVRVYNDTAAAAAGLQPGDVITTFAGQDVRDADDMVSSVRGRSPGDLVSIGIDRNGEAQVLQARLGQR
jgi:putative serine protease PepD